MSTLRSSAARCARLVAALVAVALLGALAAGAAGAVGGRAAAEGGGATDNGTTTTTTTTGGGTPTQGTPAPDGSTSPSPQPAVPRGRRSAFDGSGMWIWQVPRSSGGSLPAIVARARRHRLKTVFIKSGDAGNMWRQFTPALVSSLHAAGLNVCAWHFVYGTHPVAEALVSARAVRMGADCFVIDAEGQYEGKYASAQTYVRTLRAKIGRTYPVGLAGFPYVDYHPAFPYSVFLGPGGAQYNAPQMYWKAIGASVDRVYSHTYGWNRVFGRPVFPLGQTYGHPRTRDVRRFRLLAGAYGATGLSWWDWQESTDAMFRAVGDPVGVLGRPVPSAPAPVLGRKSRGDVVVWAQEHLVSAGFRAPIDGIFGTRTARAVRDFQFAEGLPETAAVGPLTWRRLLTYPPARVVWGARRGKASAAGGPRAGVVPRSAALPAVRDELRGKRRGR